MRCMKAVHGSLLSIPSIMGIINELNNQGGSQIRTIQDLKKVLTQDKSLLVSNLDTI